MSRKFISFALFLFILALPVLAQENTDNTVSFNGYSFRYDASMGDGVNIAQYPGDPIEGAGPGFSDAAKTQFTIYRFGQPTDSLFDTGGVRFYSMSDIAQYDFLQAEIERVQKLLTERPDLAQADIGTLPYLPIMTHGQVFTTMAQYVETETLTGIRYITVYSAALEPFHSRDFLFVFVGISTDQQHLVTVTFPINNSRFPKEPQSFDPVQFQENWPNYLAESIATLNASSSDEFRPTLTELDALIQSIRLEM